MVLCIYGFPTNVSALQFEWAWQHPAESVAVRQEAASFKSFSGVANKIKLAYTMLCLPAWNSLNITANYFSTKYTHHGAVCPSLPKHMKVQVCSVDELPCYSKGGENMFEDEKDLDDGGEHDEDSNFGEAATGINADGNTGEAAPETFADVAVSGSTDHSHSSSYQHFGWSEEREDSAIGLDNTRSFSLLDSPVRTYSKATSFCAEEIAEDVNMTGLVKESSIVFGKQKGEQELRSIPNGDEGQQPCSNEKQSNSSVCVDVEVIDLLTPSPCCRTGSNRKKRKAASTFPPEIIDLTWSPSYVQL